MVDTRVQFWDKESRRGFNGQFYLPFCSVQGFNPHCVFSLEWHKETVRSASGLSQTFALEIVCLNELWGHIHLQMV